jgi:hypothetical protein
MHTESGRTENDILSKQNPKVSRSSILIFDILDFKSRAVRSVKEGCYINGSIHQEHIIFANLHAAKMRATKSIEQIMMDLKVETGYNAIIVGASITHFHQWTDHPDF